MIYKYELEIKDNQIMKIAGFKRILSVIEQDGSLMLYTEISDSIPEDYDIPIQIIGTGHPVIGEKFIGTVKIGIFVWHVFTRRGIRVGEY